MGCRLVIAVAAFATLGAAVPAAPQSGSGAAITGRMQAVAVSFERDNLFWGSILVARAGKPILQRSYGLADAEWKTPNTLDTKFRIGSITKQFTAAAVLLLQEQGRLSIDDPIGKYLTSAPASWSRVTIRHLLTHTSGLPNITTLPDYAVIRTRAASPDELIARISAQPLDYEPGTKYSYGNSDYIVLGRLIEAVSGQSYEAFLKQHIFDPLQMGSTGVDDERSVVPRHATGYAVELDDIRHADAISMTVPFSAGNLYSTVGDLLKWETALFADKVVSASSLKMMTTPYRNGYGLGLFVGEQDGHRFISHTGDIDGFGGMLAYYPDDKLTVIVLSNLFGGAYGLVAKDIARTAFGIPFILPGERKTVVVPTSNLAQYAGVYQITPSVRNLISFKNGRLTSKIGNQAELEMVPESPTRFFFRAGEAEIEFVRDPATSKVSGLIVHQDGAAFNGAKIR